MRLACPAAVTLLGVLASAVCVDALEPQKPADTKGAAQAHLNRAADAVLARRLLGAVPPLRALLWTPFKDLLVLGIWMVGLFRRTICWRGHRLLVGPGSVLTPVEETGETAGTPAEAAFQEVA